MKKVITGLVLGLSIATSSFAVESKGYAGIGLAKTTYSKDGAEYDEINFKIFGGKKISENVAIEGHFFNIKNGSLGAGLADMKGKSLGVAGLYYLGKQEKSQPFVKLGVHRWNSDISNGLNYSGTDLFGGVGLDIANDKFTTRIEFENYKLESDIKDNITSFGVGLIFNF